MQIALIALLPKGAPWWVTWAPAIVFCISLALSGIGIILIRLGLINPKHPTYAMVYHHRIDSCMTCPVRLVKDNPVNANYPICYCKDKEMRICLSPQKVQRWCPHATR